LVVLLGKQRKRAREKKKKKRKFAKGGSFPNKESESMGGGGAFPNSDRVRFGQEKGKKSEAVKEHELSKKRSRPHHVLDTQTLV